MKVKSIPLLIILLFIFLFSIYYFKLLNRSIVENDEGVYWATFLLVDKGYKLYKEISFSQLPGFFLAVYPIFKIFGSTIAAARLGVFFWSMVALFSIIWLGYIRKNLLFSLVSVVLLISIPTFFNQSITLQSDIVATSFSTVSFVFMMTFGKSNKLVWLALSSLFFSLALLTKFDYSLVLPFGFLFVTQSKNKIFNMFLFSLVSLVMIFVTLIFFGVNNVANNVLTLREKALTIYPFEPFKIFEYLKNALLIFILIVINFLLFFFKGKKDYFFYSIFLWLVSSLILVVSFRPLFHHHLIFLAVPTVLLFTNNISSKTISLYRYNDMITLVISALVLISFISNFYNLNQRQQSKSIKERKTAENFILENTGRNDVILTDEAALYEMTGRLPPPELVDMSYVQIKSGNISSQKFRSIIKKYKPKLIIAWNGRLKEIKDFRNKILDYVTVYHSDNKIIFKLKE